MEYVSFSLLDKYLYIWGFHLNYRLGMYFLYQIWTQVHMYSLLLICCITKVHILGSGQYLSFYQFCKSQQIWRDRYDVQKINDISGFHLWVLVFIAISISSFGCQEGMRVHLLLLNFILLEDSGLCLFVLMSICFYWSWILEFDLFQNPLLHLLDVLGRWAQDKFLRR